MDPLVVAVVVRITEVDVIDRILRHRCERGRNSVPCSHHNEALTETLIRVGFHDVRLFPSLIGVEVGKETQTATTAILERR